jgi:hypothetical protein
MTTMIKVFSIHHSTDVWKHLTVIKLCFHSSFGLLLNVFWYASKRFLVEMQYNCIGHITVVHFVLSSVSYIMLIDLNNSTEGDADIALNT